MRLNKAGATLAIEKLFSSIDKLHKNSSVILVKADNCTIYIPVTQLDEAKIPEFKDKFKEIYELTQGN